MDLYRIYNKILIKVLIVKLLYSLFGYCIHKAKLLITIRMQVSIFTIQKEFLLWSRIICTLSYKAIMKMYLNLLFYVFVHIVCQSLNYVNIWNPIWFMLDLFRSQLTCLSYWHFYFVRNNISLFVTVEFFSMNSSGMTYFMLIF